MLQAPTRSPSNSALTDSRRIASTTFPCSILQLLPPPFPHSRTITCNGSLDGSIGLTVFSPIRSARGCQALPQSRALRRAENFGIGAAWSGVSRVDRVNSGGICRAVFPSVRATAPQGRRLPADRASRRQGGAGLHAARLRLDRSLPVNRGRTALVAGTVSNH
jgi:hypothetical protein